MQSGWRQGVRGDAGGGCQGMQVTGGGGLRAKHGLCFLLSGKEVIV